MISGLYSRLRTLAFGSVGFVVLIVLTQLLRRSTGDQGTPPAILFLGLLFGLLTALVAVGIILIYRSSRIINFAQAAIGGVGGLLTYHLTIAASTSFPYLLAFFVGVLASGVIGMAIELGFIRRFFNAPRLVLMVVTIALVALLTRAAGAVVALPIFPSPLNRSLQELTGAAPIPLPFDDFQFQIGGHPLPFGFEHLFAIGMALVAMAGLWMFLRFTRAGVAVRASSENADRATLLGINVKLLSTLVWIVTGLLSGTGVILTATVLRSWQTAGGSTTVLVAALAAAVVARMRSLPVAIAASVGIEILRQSIGWAFNQPEQLALFDVFLFLVILVGLLVQRAGVARSDAAGEEESSWRAVEEVRPVPRAMMEVGSVRVTRWVLTVVTVAAVLVFPFAVSTGATNTAGYIAIAGISILSLVILTGWTGQVSLGQFALVGIGALLAGGLIARWNLSFWLAIFIVPILVALFSVIVGIPALRIKGLFLAITTYAFAFAVETNLFSERYFGWILPESVNRPSLFLLDFEDERSMYFLTVTGLGLAVLIVLGLRRSRAGRIMIGLRDNEPNAQAFGVNVVRMRLSAFALSGALCGFAGVLLAVHQRAVTQTTFPAVESLNVFIFAVIGGIGSISGALLGTLYFALNRIFGGNQLLGALIGPIGLLILLYIAPGGLGSVAYGLRDSVLRIIAQRRQMIVPSLFADFDPNAIERKLIPLAEPLPGAGLATLPGVAYRIESVLYEGRGRLALKTRRPSADAEAFKAVTESLEGTDAPEVAEGARDAAAQAANPEGGS